MPEHRTEAETSNLNFTNILFALFKWKWMILCLTLIGILAATAVHFFYPAAYESDARLLVRYVLERSGYDSVESLTGTSARGSTGLTTDAVIAAEVSILTSWDLAVQVAEALGPNRVLPDSKAPTVAQAASTINSGLGTATGKGSNIIAVSYKNRKPEVATAVLNELVSRYFTKHLEVHRSAGAFDFVSQQTDQIRARLGQTEDALKQLKAKAGIYDLKDSISSLNNEATKTTEQLSDAEADLAEQRARVKLMEGSAGLSSPAPGQPASTVTSTATPPGQPTMSPQPAGSPASASPPAKDTQQYQDVVARLKTLQQSELELLGKYTDASIQVKSVRSQIADLESQKSALEKKFPSLAIIGAAQGHQDLGSERAKLAGMEAKAETLKSRLRNIQERMKQLSDAGPEIVRLERTKELEETNYKYFQGTLEKARIDEALDPSKMPNISAVQRPSPPALVTSTRDKIVLGLAGGGLALGIGIALLFELLLSRTVKRFSQLELQLRSPVMLSIPYQSVNGRLRLPWKNGQRAGKETRDKSKPNLAPWDPGHFIRSYCEAIRDRLGLYFELHGVTHKPKLVGVTGFGEGAGTSTLAAGIAAALSETGDGKVLLVDVNATNGEVHPFFAGRPAATLTTAIKPQAAITSAADNLYLATVNQSGSKSTHLGLKKFFALVPNLKASDFDYIIFDMPPINQTSPTIGLAALMDKVLLVVEAEKTSRDIVKRGYRELVGARADVAVVLNKTRSYGPNWLESGS